MTLYLDSMLFFVHRPEPWAESLAMPYSAQIVRMLCQKVVCSQHFSKADCMSPYSMQMNRMVVLTSFASA
jgi:hypothetical protein